MKRLVELDLGDAALVFGRIDRDDPESSEIEAFHIGRLAVSDEDREPVVVDWRAPVAEPFYRATGRDPMGLVRRRHFVVEGRSVLGLEDELFGEGHIGIGDDGLTSTQNELRGYSTLVASLERGRTGTLGDIVATIQAEQDEIIRSPQSGVLVVQGGPGTGKTVVALHRAAYLLYTHRFPLEDQGVLVIGPNRVFLRYIEQVLPSLGEAGIEQVVLADLIPGVKVRGTDTEATARVKGKPEMSRVIDRAIRDRERPLRDDVTFPFRSGYVRLRATESEAIIKNARRGSDVIMPPDDMSKMRFGQRWPRTGGRVMPHQKPCVPNCVGESTCVKCLNGCGRCSPQPSCSTTSLGRQHLFVRRAGAC